MNIFKKITAGVLALTIGMCAIPSGVSASMNESYRKGDIDGDGDVDNTDSAYLSNFLSGIKGSANNQMSQRLDVDLSGIIDKLDKDMLSSMITNGSNPIYYAYEINNSGVPDNSTSNIYYRQYDAQTGELKSNNGCYYLPPLSDISTASPEEPELNRIGTDYSNKGIVGINAYYGNYVLPGTGFVVGHNKILTAAHCVFDTDNDVSTHSVTIEVYDGVGYTPNIYNASSYHIPQAYYDLSSYLDAPGINDYAIITVSTTFPDSYIMNLGVARDKLKNNQPSSVYESITDNLGIERLCLYLTGRAQTMIYPTMWTQEGYFKSVDINNNNNYVVMDDKRCFYNPDLGMSGQSGSPIYVQTEDEEKTVIGVGSGGTSDYGFCGRITTDILHFVFNNPYL